MGIPLFAQAAFWGALAGSALLLGAAGGYLAPLPRRVVAAIMAFGGGVLISALSFDLMDEAYRAGGFLSSAGGFIVGAATFTGANLLLARRGARHRKRSQGGQPTESEHQGSGAAIAVGSLLDGIPESIAIGVSLLAGGTVSWVVVAAVFVSNVPEGLSSSAGMKRAGRSAGYIFGVWSAIALSTGVAAALGVVVFAHLPAGSVALVISFAAGAILAMLADTMMPEAFEHAHDLAGFVTVVGFLLAFALTKLAGG